MATGRTLYEILTGANKPVELDAPYNPLGAKVGCHAAIDVLDFRADLWSVTEIWSWSTQGRAQNFPMADYVLASGERRCLLKVVPKRDVKPGLSVLLMTQYWPDEPGPYAWGAESEPVIQALDDASGEFYRFRGEENEEKYWRIGGAVPLYANVSIAAMAHAGVAASATEGAKFTYWDFHRVTTDEGGSEITQYLFANLSGRYSTPCRVVGGDKTLVMYRGVEIDPKNVTLYGAK